MLEEVMLSAMWHGFKISISLSLEEVLVTISHGEEEISFSLTAIWDTAVIAETIVSKVYEAYGVSLVND